MALEIYIEYDFEHEAEAKQAAALKKASMIRRIGPTKGGFWEVVEFIPEVTPR